MIADTPWVRIVIVNYNAGALLQSCVDALAMQTASAFEVKIVDNGSSRPPITELQLPDDRFSIIDSGGNIGFAAGSNLGARGAACPWLAMLNPDTRPRPNWLTEMRAAMERYPWAKMFGSTQLNAADPAVVDGFGDMFSVVGAAWRAGNGRSASDLPDEDCEVFSPCAAASVYANSAFNAVGGFDERFFCYLEDVDLGFRLRLQGECCVQVRRAEVLHEGSAVAGHLSDFSIYHSYRNRIRLLAKDMPGLLYWPTLPLQVAAIVLAISRRPKHFRQAAIRGLREGLRALPNAFASRQEIQRRRVVTAAEVAQMLVWNPLGRGFRLPRPISWTRKQLL